MPKITGVTIVKNAEKFDYPIVECIQSALPLVDEMVVSIGDGDDGTLDLVKSINSNKIKIVHSIWDKTLVAGGEVLAAETDKAIAQVSTDTDWILYLQADEVLHEKDYDAIKNAIKIHHNNKRVEGLLFNYHHFYGNFNYVGDSRRWYLHEIRLIRNINGMASYRDAQGFRKNGKHIKVKKINAAVFHYGWVRTPKAQIAKLSTFYSYWNGGNTFNFETEMYNYMANVDSLAIFEGTHPAVMKSRIDNWQYPLQWDVTKRNLSFKDKILYKIEKLTGKRLFDYQNYKLI